MDPNNRHRLLVLILIIVLVGLFFALDLQQYLTLENLKSEQDNLNRYYQNNPLQLITVYMALYVIMAALSLPGALLMTVAGGAIFGLGVGTIAVSFASTIGATLAFLASRFLLKEVVQNRFGNRLSAINDGFEKDGPFYLFTLRLIPLFPFFVINLVMGLLPIRAWKFFLVSQVGMLPGTMVYINAGEQIASIDSLAGILSLPLLLSFALLGIFPLLARKFVAFVKSRRLLKDFPRPSRFDYNLIVIGGGSGGLVSAYIAAAVKAKVALIERHKWAGIVSIPAVFQARRLFAQPECSPMPGVPKHSDSGKVKSTMSFLR